MQVIRRRYGEQIERPRLSNHLRGIDYYNPDELILAIARGAEFYQSVHGELPSLVDPRTYNEKLFWMKVFCDIPHPSPGNKLAVGSFIPLQIAHLISPVKPLWVSDRVNLPSNDLIPLGNYFFKANYGSGYQVRVAYPISEYTRHKTLSKARKWPRRSDVEGTGEWWYFTYPKEYFLEPSVSGAASPNEFQYTVLGGKVGFIQHIRNRFETYQRNIYDRDFRPLNLNIDGTAQGEFVAAPAEFFTMRKVAEVIGSQFKYARVDMFLQENGELKLNEITLCPGNCSGVFDDLEQDRRFADMADALTFVR